MGNRLGEGFDSNAPALKNVNSTLMPQWKISHPSKVFNQAFNPESHSELWLKRAVDLLLHQESLNEQTLGAAFPGGSVSKESTCNARDPGSIPRSGRSPGGRHGTPLQYSCLENPMDRGAWWTTVQRVAKSQMRLSTIANDGNIPTKKFHWNIYM